MQELKEQEKLDPFLQEEISEEKQRVRDAVVKHCKKEARKLQSKRRNDKPEERVVEMLMEFYRQNGFFMRRYESKAKNINGVWRTSGVETGTPDLMGVCPRGYFHACEVKAKGRRSTVREEQRDFLMNVIKRGGFACVGDSVEFVRGLYDKFFKLSSKSSRRELLIEAIPKSRQAYDESDLSSL